MNHFVHLRVHTEYSLVDSVVRVDPLVESLERLNMPACAITDQGNVSALVKFYRAAFDHGVKPIIGADLWIAESTDDREPTRLTVLCQNRIGFKRLSALLTRSAAQTPVAGRSVVLKNWLDVDAVLFAGETLTLTITNSSPRPMPPTAPPPRLWARR